MTSLKSIRNTTHLLVIALALSSCSNDDNSTTAESSLTEDEVVIVIESSMQSNSGGLSETTASYSSELNSTPTLESLCNIPQEQVFPFNHEGNLITASYNVAWNYELSCNNFNVPQSIDFASSATGNFSGQRMSSNDMSSSQFLVTGLQPASLEYIFNGSYKRDGSQSLTTNFNTRGITSTLTMTLNDILVDKNTNRIVSGSGSFNLDGTTEQTDPFSFEGNIVFLGDGRATITINGTQYEIDIN